MNDRWTDAELKAEIALVRDLIKVAGAPAERIRLEKRLTMLEDIVIQYGTRDPKRLGEDHLIKGDE